MELLTPAFFSALAAIIVIDLVLAGDNAIVIALAARSLPDHLRSRAVIWGTVGAVVVRSVMTLGVVWLLKVPGLLALGGLLLLWIAYKLLVNDEKPGEHIAAASTFGSAMRTIIIADAVMGVDNVLAVAGAAHGSYLLVVLGLLISIPIVIWGSTLILKYTERFPVIVYIGSAVLVFTGAKMFLSEPVVKETLAGETLVHVLVYVLAVGGVMLAGYVRNLRGRMRGAMRTQAAIRRQFRHREAGTPSVDAAADGDQGVANRVLLPVDGSRNALAAVRQVIDDAMRSNVATTAVLVNVQPKFSQYVARFIPGTTREAYHQEQAGRALQGAKDLLTQWGVSHEAHVLSGDRADVIAQFAQDQGCTRIVIGTARRNSLTRLFENSVTASLLERARVPVEIVVGTDASRIERFGVPASVGAALAAAIITAD